MVWDVGHRDVGPLSTSTDPIATPSTSVTSQLRQPLPAPVLQFASRYLKTIAPEDLAGSKAQPGMFEAEANDNGCCHHSERTTRTPRPPPPPPPRVRQHAPASVPYRPSPPHHLTTSPPSPPSYPDTLAIAPPHHHRL